MKIAYTFSVLRYVHDPVTNEFVNIGVALYSKEAKYLQAICAPNYARITRMFTKIDGDRFRQMTRYIQGQIRALGERLSTELPFENTGTLETILAKVLPPDDSSFQFSPVGGGLTSNPEKALGELYERCVEQYATAADSPRRDDDEVWRVFREPLERRNITAVLGPKRIIAQSYDYEFQHSWKNEVWHACEPVSFDMVEASSMLEKANRWVGRATSLLDSNEKFVIHMLLGEPQDGQLQTAFIKAQNILNKMPGNKEFIRESEAEHFAAELAREIKNYRQG
jgi:hypothetical protein